jgi:sucrose-6-phosphate hydrolase SacC (GH32 family)
VQVAASNFSSGGALVGYTNSSGVFTSDNQDHGVDTPVNGAIQSGCISITTGGEPTGETDRGPDDSIAAQDANSDLTQDFGFYKIVLGDSVWNDANKNGLLDNGESGFAGVTVNLLSANSCNATVLQTTTTNSVGKYSFNVAQGTYSVQVAVPSSFVPTTPYDTTPNDNIDNDSNGFTQCGTYVNSNPITLAPGVISGGQMFNNSTGTTTNPTLDFGFKAYATAVTLSSFNASNGSPGASLYLGIAIAGVLSLAGAGLYLARKKMLGG